VGVLPDAGITYVKYITLIIFGSGGFYQDSLAFYGERAYGNGCQMCDDGTFVRKAPGRRKDDCKPCPEGIIKGFMLEAGVELAMVEFVE
jgi:hypothetical protein